MNGQSHRAQPRSSPQGSAVAVWRRQPLSRRRLLQATGGLAIAAGLGAGTRTAPAAAQGNVGGTLTMLCWQGYDGPNAAVPFREQNGVEIQATYLGSNDEIFATLRAGGLGDARHRHALPRLREEPLRGRSPAGDRLQPIAEHDGLHSPLPEAGVEHLRRQDLLGALRLGHRADDLQRQVHPRGAGGVDGRDEARVHGQGGHDRRRTRALPDLEPGHRRRRSDPGDAGAARQDDRSADRDQDEAGACLFAEHGRHGRHHGARRGLALDHRLGSDPQVSRRRGGRSALHPPRAGRLHLRRQLLHPEGGAEPRHRLRLHRLHARPRGAGDRDGRHGQRHRQPEGDRGAQRGDTVDLSRTTISTKSSRWRRSGASRRSKIRATGS